MDDRVLICGFPSSGNRFVANLIQHHGFKTTIVHFGDASLTIWNEAIKRAVMPIRDPDATSCSWDARNMMTNRKMAEHGPCLDAMPVHYLRTMYELANHGMAVLPVRYENLEAEGPRIIGWLGANWKGWHTPFINQNDKYAEVTCGAE